MLYDHLKYIYHPDHDERYVHIPPEQRDQYPDEIVDEHTGRSIAIRKYTMKEIEVMYEYPWKFRELSSDVNGVSACFETHIYAKDVPMSDVLEKSPEVREWHRRANRPMTDEEFERKRRAIEWYEKNIWNRVS